jgi:hypothetical protein
VRRGVLAVLLWACWVLAVAAPAMGAGWAPEAVPPPQPVSGRELTGVSCASASSCVAVGVSSPMSGPSPTVPLAEMWDGTDWTLQQMPSPPAAQRTYVHAVSCGAATACMAVGEYLGGAGVFEGFAETWDGNAWSVENPPLPADTTYSSLQSVTCGSATQCMVRGEYQTASDHQTQTFLDSWDGSSWTTEDVPAPAATSSPIIWAVSCASPTACTVVGTDTDSGGDEESFASDWDGSSWTTQTIPTPVDPNQPYFTGLSCTSDGACTAVGVDSVQQVIFSEHRDGTGWSIQTMSRPAAANYATVYGVSCQSATSCTAVGAYFSPDTFPNPPPSPSPLVESWDGSSWAHTSGPLPAAARNGLLESVSCAFASTCETVGFFYDKGNHEVALAERGSPGDWTIQHTPRPSQGHAPSLDGVSCTDATTCEAVGSFTDSVGTTVRMADVWNGTTWVMQKLDHPYYDDGDNALYGIGCLPGSCISVGSLTTTAFSAHPDGLEEAFAEHWNGSSWQNIVRIRSGANGTVLRGVSCASTTACFAVGHFINSRHVTVTMAQHPGTSTPWWLVVKTPNRAGAKASYLNGVSCPTTTDCTAVGYYKNKAGVNVTLAEQWNGTAWTAQRTVDRVGAKAGYLDGVSCTTPDACTAVGHYITTSGATSALVERWNGSTWTVQAFPKKAGATGTSLSGVSCTSDTTCTAVGHYVNTIGHNVGLAEAWDGAKWSAEKMSLPTGTRTSVLDAVSCPTSTSCMATGGYTDHAGNTFALAEQFTG